MNFSESIAHQLKYLGYTHCFFVPGGGSMHLLNAFRKVFNCVPVVHEVAAGIAVESFNETSENKKAFALVTSGPGFTNIVTALAQAFVEFRPLLVIGGQVKSSDLATPGMRQRGVQEIDGKRIAASITCKSITIKEPISMKEFVDCVQLTEFPTPGPVFIEVCLDIQARHVSSADDVVIDLSKKNYNKFNVEIFEKIENAVSQIRNAKRPVFILGNNLSRKSVRENYNLLQKTKIPLLSTTASIDRLPSDYEMNFGFGGTWGGNYYSNVIISQCDLIVSFGAKLDLQSTGYNIEDFIGATSVIQVFPDNAELSKNHFKNLLQINWNPDYIFEYILDQLQLFEFSNDEWVKYCKMVRSSIPTLMVEDTENYVNPQKLINRVTNFFNENVVFSFCSSGAASFTHALQAAQIKEGQKVNVSPSFASMGVGLPAAIGCAVANPGKIILHFEGDGGFAQNLQEIGTLERQKLPIKIFIFDNSGYASIRNTQKKYFDETYLGCDSNTGLGLPNWKNLFSAYNLSSNVIQDLDCLDSREFKNNIFSPDPFAWIVKVNPNLEYLPAVTTRINNDGNMISEPLSKMLPELEANLKEKIYRYRKI